MYRSSGTSRHGHVAPRRSAAAAGGLSAALSLMLAACQSEPGATFGVDSRQFQDVVVPAGFRLNDGAHESYSREDASLRQGHFLYAGSLPIDDAASYVLQRMPQHSWRLVHQDSSEEAGVHMRFERGVYAADYVLSRVDGRTQMVVDYSTDYSRR